MKYLLYVKITDMAAEKFWVYVYKLSEKAW
jgi:hypothetical protein